MSSASDESTTEGDDRSYGPLTRGLEKLGSTHEIGHAGARQRNQPDVVLTEVGPTGRRIVEGCLDPGREPACRTKVAPESDHSHLLFQLRVFQPSWAVDNHDDPVGREPLSANE
jgi:hypothetical protein